MKRNLNKKLNCTITNCVIKLHQKGYTDDFSPIDGERIRCMQNGENFSTCNLRIRLIDCGYDLLTKTFQYIHTIDTQAGNRGILITNGIMPLNG